jgi:Zn ribbon nucleic-acid-binding protein
MNLICPECKNKVELSSYSNLAVNSVVECAMCGITLMVKSIEGEEVKAEVMDEGK